MPPLSVNPPPLAHLDLELSAAYPPVVAENPGHEQQRWDRRVCIEGRVIQAMVQPGSAAPWMHDRLGPVAKSYTNPRGAYPDRKKLLAKRRKHRAEASEAPEHSK